MKHIMLDIETLSSKHNAAIASIGAVRFDLNQLKLGEEFYHVIDLRSSPKGMDIDPDTLYWWMNQSETARAIFSDSTVKVGIKKALAEFSYFVRNASVSNPLIWGNGSTFDNVIVSNAYEFCGIPKPWSHKQDVCFRTIRRIFPHDKIEEGTKHNALQDAKNQALTMIEVFRSYKGEFIP